MTLFPEWLCDRKICLTDLYCLSPQGNPLKMTASNSFQVSKICFHVTFSLSRLNAPFSSKFFSFPNPLTVYLFIFCSSTISRRLNLLSERPRVRIVHIWICSLSFCLSGSFVIAHISPFLESLLELKTTRFLHSMLTFLPIFTQNLLLISRWKSL